MKRFLILLLALGLFLSLAGCRPEAPPQTAPPTAAPPEPQPTGAPTAPSTAPTEPGSPTEATFPATVPTEPPADPRTVLNFLKIAKMPVGSTMYIWGGGWNEEDTGAGPDAVTLGVSPQWAEFAAQQDSSYNYNDYRYHIRKGLDCSGFVGWAVYNVLETENGRPGYVFSSTKVAQTYADMGLGTYIPAQDMTRWQAGDIMSLKGHVWICLGMCGDGSVLMLHANLPGVMFAGTKLADGSESDAIRLARQIMQTHYPDWYSRFPQCSSSYGYLTQSAALRWTVLSDPEGLTTMTAEEVAAALFAETP